MNVHSEQSRGDGEAGSRVPVRRAQVSRGNSSPYRAMDTATDHQEPSVEPGQRAGVTCKVQGIKRV